MRQWPRPIPTQEKQLLRFSPTVRATVAIATAGPFIAFSISGVAMVAFALGFWDRVAPYLRGYDVEAFGWSAILTLGALLAALHLALLLFYGLHAAINPTIPVPIRFLIVFGLLWIPLPIMAVYCLLFILPTTGRLHTDDRDA